MFTRIVMLMLIAVLALPVTTLTRPAETSQAPWGDIAVAAKGKKHKNTKKDKQPKSQTVVHTERQSVTQTFTSTGPITIPNGAPTTDKGPANPYPSAIEVNGFTNGVITDVNLILTDVTHAHASDIDILLSADDGRRALVMSDRGVGEQVINLDLTLDDEAAAEVPETGLTSGTFRPTNSGSNDDTFAAPAPAPNGNVSLSTFDGADPNGNWHLWVMDDAFFDYGDIGEWTLQITAETDVQVQEQIQAKDKKHNKKGKKGKR
jgi:hypothetical protein